MGEEITAVDEDGQPSREDTLGMRAELQNRTPEQAQAKLPKQARPPGRTQPAQSGGFGGKHMDRGAGQSGRCDGVNSGKFFGLCLSSLGHRNESIRREEVEEKCESSFKSGYEQSVAVQLASLTVPKAGCDPAGCSQPHNWLV